MKARSGFLNRKVLFLLSSCCLVGIVYAVLALLPHRSGKKIDDDKEVVYVLGDTLANSQEDQYIQSDLSSENHVKRQQAVIMAKTLQVLDEPSTAGTVVATVKRDAIFEVEKQEDDWIMIKTEDGKTGWLNKEYVSIEYIY